jgi:hypothetical protein
VVAQHLQSKRPLERQAPSSHLGSSLEVAAYGIGICAAILAAAMQLKVGLTALRRRMLFNNLYTEMQPPARESQPCRKPAKQKMKKKKPRQKEAGSLALPGIDDAV